MKIGYGTNAWGIGAGWGGGVCSIKDMYYISLGDEDEKALAGISAAGFEYVEMLEGNARRYFEDKAKFVDTLDQYNLKLNAVYTGANFIYKDAFEDEFMRIKELCGLLKELDVPTLVVGGGAIRYGQVPEDDYKLLGEGLNRVKEYAGSIGISTGYHSHLGTIVITRDEIDKVMRYTEMDMIPDIAHIAAGGSDPLEVVRSYIDRIKYAHMRDYDTNAKAFRQIGLGNLALKQIMQLFDEHGVEITVEAADGAYDNADEGALIAASWLRAYYAK